MRGPHVHGVTPGRKCARPSEMSFPKMCVYLQLDLKGAKVEGEQCHAVCMMRSKPVKLYEFFFFTCMGVCAAR